MDISQANDRLKEIESARNELEQKLSKLQKALKTWQTWEVEYEGLKEELEGMNEGATVDELMTVGRDFGGNLVTEKEMQDLFRGNGGAQRTPEQIISLLSRRMEYVRKNVEAVEKQLQPVKERLEVLLSDPEFDVKGKSTEQSTEVVEKLDDEGVVMSSTTSDPRKAASEVLKVLDQAGIKDGSEATKTSNQSEQPSGTVVVRSATEKTQDTSEKRATNGIIKSGQKKEGSILANSNASKPRSAKKSVRFSSDTKQEAPPSKTRIPSNKSVASRLANKIPAGKANPKKSSPTAKKNASVEATFNDDINLHSAVIPLQESSDEAALRKEMLEYNMSEVGAVVAELSLVEDEDDDEDDDGNGVVENGTDEDEEDDDDEEDEEEEDKYGRSTRRVINAKYRREMEALQKKMAMREKERSLGVNGNTGDSITASQSTLKEASSKTSPSTKPSPLAEMIVERAPASIPTSATTKAPSKTNLNENADEENEGDTGNDVDVDKALLQQNLARERIRLRNRLIYRQGGFLEPTEDEQAFIPLDDDDVRPPRGVDSVVATPATTSVAVSGSAAGEGTVNGDGDRKADETGGDANGNETGNAEKEKVAPKKRVSRFKAARLKT